MTPLFPNADEPLILKQGEVDDCYLLASLDCIFNGGAEYLQLLKSKFVRTKDGVTLRIKRTDQSAYLKPEKMKGKYTYFQDTLTNEDVFILSEKVLKEIDDSEKSVQTNSLAVKILERISSYYYVEEWDHLDEMASIKAHSIKLRHSETSTVFVGKLIGIQAYDGEDFDEILKLKLMKPQEPVYMSMAYGEADVMGKIHERHSLRIDSVVPKPHGDYEVILVNPWDNQKRERYFLKELKKRDCRFCIFSTNQQEYELTRILLKNPVERGKYIFEHPELVNMLLEIQTMNLLRDSKPILSCISLHQQMPYLMSLYNVLLVDGRVKLIQSVVESGGDMERFIKLLITKVPQKDLIKIILQSETLQDQTVKVLVDMAIEAKKQKSSPASHLFNKLSFFNLIVDAAIYQRSKKLKCSVENAKQKIESGIINYYFDNHKRNKLAQHAGLQDFFIANIFSNAWIEKKYTPRFLLAYAVAKFISAKNFSLAMIAHIQSSDASLVNEVFLNEILFNCPCENPRELFAGLHALNQLNLELAQALLPLAIKKIKLLFNVSMTQLTTDVALEKSSEFKWWFISLTRVAQSKPVDNPDPQSLLIQKAKRVVSTYVEKIKNFPVVFDYSLGSQSIELRCANLILTLENKVRRNPDLREATKVLGFISLHPEISDVLADKKRIIQEIAAQQIKQKKAEKVIMNIVEQINLFPFSFEKIITSKAIELHCTSLIAKLNELTKVNPLLNQALQILGLKDLHPQIILAMTNKIELIKGAASQQKLSLERAESAVQSYVKQINDFPFSFSNVVTTKSVVLTRTFLMRQLEDIVKGKDLSEAQLTLGYFGQHPEITDALNNKKRAIQLEAGMTENAITSKNEAFKTIQYIKFATYLESVRKLVEILEGKAENNKNYQKIAEKGRNFYNTLATAQYIFLNSGKPKEKNTAEFKKNCLNAIETVPAVLLEHHGWMRAIGDINKALSSIITLASIHGTTGRCGLFTQPINAKTTHKLPLTLPVITIGSMASA
ncbi:hypothetical protein [Legionella maioricensis]|uniref:Ninein n=1 Tax=Legionella maioricensis TaxID=2896528 RepID=A0A9X2CZM3_9GAMM|nr:hypothetical protein [Legionella maioricensis]MCL9683642.1 hypothetical protein [Legionella maioricensis]MCL9687664.1 hypothetical protein [Legionella maioricensis]